MPRHGRKRGSGGSGALRERRDHAKATTAATTNCSRATTIHNIGNIRAAAATTPLAASSAPTVHLHNRIHIATAVILTHVCAESVQRLVLGRVGCLRGGGDGGGGEASDAAPVTVAISFAVAGRDRAVGSGGRRGVLIDP